MPYYETVFMARQDLSEKQVQDLTEKFSAILKEDGGKILKTENWGIRTLAYRINKARKAHYVLIESETKGENVIEMERIMRIEEDVMRSLTTRLDAPTTGPSPMMEPQKDRDSRDSRDGDTDKKKEAA
jgi:small subunit ribosomal protein S6